MYAGVFVELAMTVVFALFFCWQRRFWGADFSLVRVFFLRGLRARAGGHGS
jgi:hypothetical protein